MTDFQLNDDDVILMASPSNSFAKVEVCKFSKLKSELQNHLSSASPLTMQYVQDGKVCQVLKTTGGGWRKGHMRLRLELEFVPDEPEPTSSKAPDIVPSPNSEQ